MKQKIVIKVSMNGQPSQSLMACFSGPNSRSRALQIAVGLPGVEQAALGGTEKDRIEVSGDGIDAAELTNLLRKKVGFADIISVTPVEAKKEEKKVEKKEEKKEETKMMPALWPHGMPHCQIYEMRGNCVQYHDPYPCSIL